MRKQTKLKAFVLSVMMLAGMILPVSAFAQSDGFFRYDGDYSNRDVGSTFYGDITGQGFGATNGNITGQTFGDGAPMGSGLFVLLASGAGYAILKSRKKQNRKEN